MVAWADGARTAERWLIGAECITCHAPASDREESLVCGVCRLRWRPVPDPICTTCGEPSDLGLACRLCVGWPRGFTSVRSAVTLDAGVRHLVHQLKYDGWWRLADVFAQRMVGLLHDAGEGADLVPIPLAPGRARSRGYNQAAHLARALGELTARPVCAARLSRVRETPSQTRLALDARASNLDGAFAARVDGRRAVLVDDVFTTGATLCSAAKTLLDAGASDVRAVTFARAAPPLMEVALQPGFTNNLKLREDRG